MDIRHDNLTLADTGVPAGAAIDSVASGIKDIAANIRNRAKAKKAQAISDAGGYNTLTPFQKSLIPVPPYALNTETPTAADAVAAEPVGGIRAMLPWLLGAAVVGFIIFMIVRR